MTILIVLVLGLICGLICVRVAKNRGMNGGFWWGFFLGVIGIIVVALRPNDQKQQSSAEAVEEETEVEIPKKVYRFVCANCGKKSTGWYEACPNCGASNTMERLKTDEVVIDEAAAAMIEAKKKENAEKKATAETLKAQNVRNADSAFSVADEITKLKELADSGVITQEQFDAKKKQLLDS